MSPNIEIDRERIEAFCRKWKIVELSLFGSVLRDDFREGSDVDVMVTFAEDAQWSAFDHFDAEDELAELFGREVSLVTKRSVEEQDNWLRKRHILSSAQTYYAA